MILLGRKRGDRETFPKIILKCTVPPPLKFGLSSVIFGNFQRLNAIESASFLHGSKAVPYLNRHFTKEMEYGNDKTKQHHCLFQNGLTADLLAFMCRQIVIQY